MFDPTRSPTLPAPRAHLRRALLLTLVVTAACAEDELDAAGADPHALVHAGWSIAVPEPMRLAAEHGCAQLDLLVPRALLAAGPLEADDLATLDQVHLRCTGEAGDGRGYRVDLDGEDAVAHAVDDDPAGAARQAPWRRRVADTAGRAYAEVFPAAPEARAARVVLDEVAALAIQLVAARPAPLDESPAELDPELAPAPPGSLPVVVRELRPAAVEVRRSSATGRRLYFRNGDWTALPIGQPPAGALNLAFYGRIWATGALLTRANLDAGSDTDDKSRKFNRMFDAVAADQAGHLIANRLGGSGRFEGQSTQLFPQLGNINGGTYRVLEDKVYRFVATYPGVHQVCLPGFETICPNLRQNDCYARVTVELTYPGDRLRPNLYDYRVEHLAGGNNACWRAWTTIFGDAGATGVYLQRFWN